MQFVLASHNKKKLAELSSIVSSLGIEIIPLPEGAPEPEENGKTFEENALIKAKSAAEFTGLPALADDSGLCVDALDGAPGIYSARYCEGTDEDRNAFLLKNMQDKENRACRFVCAIACVLADGETLTVRGVSIALSSTLPLTSSWDSSSASSSRSTASVTPSLPMISVTASGFAIARSCARCFVLSINVNSCNFVIFFS